MAIDHTARARKAWPILVKVARTGSKRITYAELCKPLGLHHRAAGWFLGVIQTHCKKHGLPPLQALAVNKRTRVPGGGYIATPRGGAKYKAALAKVYKKKWQTHAPKFDN